MTVLFITILKMSLGGALMAALIVGARTVIVRRSGPFLALLYGLLMLRLMLPFSVSSPFNLQNLIQMPQAPTSAAVQSVPDAGSQSHAMTVQDNSVGSQDTDMTVPQPVEYEGATSAPSSPTLSPIEIAAIIWLAGAGLISVLMAVGNIRFVRRLQRNRQYDEPGFAALLDECKAQLGLRQNIVVLQAKGLSAAAVYGVIRPKLLISPESFAPLSPEQKRHVLLHELSHIRRHDTAVCLLAVALSILHWFNPFVWFAFWLMRRDIEISCDDSVIKALGDNERHSYAATLLELVLPSQTPRLVTALFISNSSVKKRILSIARRKRASALSSAIALVLTIVIAVTGCASPGIGTPSATTAPTPSNSSQPTVAPSITSSASEVLGMISYGISDDVMASSAALANIDQAISMLNGLEISRGGTLSMMQALNWLEDTGKWQSAMTTGWAQVCNMENSTDNQTPGIDSAVATQQAGGGIETVAAALCGAAVSVGLKPTVKTSKDNSLPWGDLMITNPLFKDVILKISRTNNMVMVSVSTAAAYDATIPLTSYVFDFSSFAQDSARVANIQKAAAMLDNTIVQSGHDNHIIFDRQITAENGWQKAPSLSWPEYGWVMNDVGWTPTLSNTQKYETPQVGGGLDLVLAAIYRAFSDANLPGIDLGFSEENFGQGGDLVITSDYASDILIRLSASETNLTVTLYDFSGVTAAANSPNNAIFSMGLSDNITNESLMNIRKAAKLLNGLHIAYGQQISVMDSLGDISEANGWQTAPCNGWGYVSQLMKNHRTEITGDSSPGGGIEEVIFVLLLAVNAAKLDQSVSVPDDPNDLTGGDALITNNTYKSGVTIYVTVDDSITAQVILPSAQKK